MVLEAGGSRRKLEKPKRDSSSLRSFGMTTPDKAKHPPFEKAKGGAPAHIG
jgi:hypothetical protein